MADFELASEVETEATSGTGERDSKDSEWSSLTAPEGFVINKDKVTVEVLVERGSEHDYNMEFADLVEFVHGTGVELPRTIKLKTHARSEKKHFGGGGAMSVKAKGNFIKIPEM